MAFQNDDEWNNFEEIKRPDLSNLKLKLGQLTIDETNENNQNDRGGSDYDGNDNFQNDGDNSENPWKKANATPAQAAPKPEVVKPTGAFVPSQLRQEVNIRTLNHFNCFSFIHICSRRPVAARKTRQTYKARHSFPLWERKKPSSQSNRTREMALRKSNMVEKRRVLVQEPFQSL